MLACIMYGSTMQSSSTMWWFLGNFFLLSWSACLKKKEKLQYISRGGIRSTRGDNFTWHVKTRNLMAETFMAGNFYSRHRIKVTAL